VAVACADLGNSYPVAGGAMLVHSPFGRRAALAASVFVIALLTTLLIAANAAAPMCLYTVVIPLSVLAAGIVIAVRLLESQAARHGADLRAGTDDSDESADGGEDQPAEATVRLIFDVVAEQLDRQFNQVDKLNGRAQQLLTFAGTLLGALIVFRPPEKNTCISIFFGGGVSLFLLVMWTTLRAWAVRGWGRDPNPRELWDAYQLWPEPMLRIQLILNWILNSRENEVQIRVKARILTIATALAGAEAAYFAAFMIARPYLS